ncbi:MAG: hypothetical protein JRE43_10340 [Deltaproteobacteria bacterium]|jgi:hypothetical protein|nr:hypothetical protein [Deltaproteobacteria bacterium]MBW2540894.1 hypothetical protein [Deltaproteobacteria bacterium]
MRSYQVFASMSPELAVSVMSEIAKESPQAYKQALLATSASMNARPVYIQKLPFDKQVAAVRRTLSRVAANGVAEEILAVYFLECRVELLTEWLDLLGLKHEDGILEADSPPAPEKAALQKARDTFCKAGDDADRALLLRAFAAQSAIDWPDLEALLDG